MYVWGFGGGAVGVGGGGRDAVGDDNTRVYLSSSSPTQAAWRRLQPCGGHVKSQSFQSGTRLSSLHSAAFISKSDEGKKTERKP